MSKIKEYVNKALSYEGYLEKKSNAKLESFTENAGSNNYTRFNRDYGKYTGVSETYWQAQPWCAMFVSVCIVETLNGDIKKAKEMFCGNLYCNVNTAYSAFKAKNRIFSTPEVGDLIFFYNDSRTKYAHIGLVYNVTADKVYTIEGNTSSGSSVIPNGGGVVKKSYSRSNKYIGGYGRLIESKEEETYQTTDKDYVVSVKTSLNVRSGPGTNYSVVKSVKNGVEVHITKLSSNKWGYADNLGGWVSMEYLKDKPVVQATISNKYKVTALKGVNVRKGAGTKYAIVAAIPKNTIVTITTKLNGWGYNPTYKGWISMDYLKELK